MTNQQRQIQQNQARELANIILGAGQGESPGSLSLPQGSQSIQLLQGVVVRVTDQGYVDVQIAGADLIIPRLRYLEGYNPAPGDVIWLMRKGRDTLILGRLRNIVNKINGLPVPLVVGGGGGADPAFGTGFGTIAFVTNGLKAQCYLDPDGVTHIRGEITNVSGGTGTMFVLPPEMRPYQQATFGCSRVNNLVDMPQVDILTNGNVVLQTSLAAGSVVNLQNICFPSVSMPFSKLQTVNLGVGVDSLYGLNSHHSPMAFVRDDGWVLLTGWCEMIATGPQIGDGSALVQLGDVGPPFIMTQKHFYFASGLGAFAPQFSRVSSYSGAVVIPGSSVATDVHCLDGVNFFTSQREEDWLLFGVDIPWYTTAGKAWQNVGPDARGSAGIYKDKYGVVHARGNIRPNGAGFNNTNYVTELIPYEYMTQDGEFIVPSETGAGLTGQRNNIFGTTSSPATAGVKRYVLDINLLGPSDPWDGRMWPENSMGWDTTSQMCLWGTYWRTDLNSLIGYV